MNISRNKDRWDSLSMKEKSDMMKAAVQQGIYNLSEIRKAYNEYAEGGPENNGNPRPVTTGGAGYVPSSSSNVQIFNKEKIYNRVLPTEMTGANTGPLDSVKQYLFNNDRAVDEWFEDYVPYINNSYGDAVKASRIINDLYSNADTEKEQEFLENSSTWKSLRNKKLAPEMFVQEDGKDTYLGMPQRFGTMRDAEYHPANGKLVNGKYVSYMRDPIFVDTEIIPTYQNYMMGITRKDNPESNVQRVTKNGNALVYMPFLNNATMSKGYDPNRGEYISIYDDWDYNTAVLGKAGDNISKFIGGQPFSIYDRYYLDDIFDVPKDKRGSYYLPEVTVTPEKKSLGGPLVQKANKFYAGGEENQPYTPFLNETPMQAAIRQLQSPEAQAAYWNATHPQTTNETPIVAQPDGTFRREVRNIPLNTSAEAAKTALEFTPVVGDVMFAGDVANEARQGNYGTAAALAGLALLPNYAEKPLKKVLKKVGVLGNKEVEGLASLRTDITSKIPAVRALKASQKAEKDIVEMNKYHTANVAEYNKATGSDVIVKPFRENILGSTTKVLPDEDFNSLVKQMKTNSPSDDISNIGGLYSWKDDTTYLRQNGNVSNAYHEFLHRGNYGITNPEVTKWRIDQLIDSDKIKNLSSRYKEYYFSEKEFPVHLRQQGENMGINVGDPFPGEEAFDEMLFNEGLGGAAVYVKGLNPAASLENKKLAWKALNGTLFNYAAPVAIGGTAAASYANQQGLGGPLVQLANRYAEGGPYKPGTIYGRPVEEGLEIVSPEFDALLIGKAAANAAKEAAGELLNSGIEGTARQRAAITSRRFGREMTKRSNEVKGWSRTLMDDIKDGNYADVPLDLKGLTRNVWETGRYIKNTPERYVENTLPKFYRNVFRRTYNNIKPAVPMIFSDDNDE